MITDQQANKGIVELVDRRVLDGLLRNQDCLLNWTKQVQVPQLHTQRCQTRTRGEMAFRGYERLVYHDGPALLDFRLLRCQPRDVEKRLASVGWDRSLVDAADDPVAVLKQHMIALFTRLGMLVFRCRTVEARPLFSPRCILCESRTSRNLPPWGEGRNRDTSHRSSYGRDQRTPSSPRRLVARDRLWTRALARSPPWCSSWR
jgi:hypothetical protein